jgi:uncharacterized damage-inducible protein DinB
MRSRDLQVAKLSISGGLSRLTRTPNPLSRSLRILSDSKDTDIVNEGREADRLARAFIGRAVDFIASEYLPKIERCLEQLDDKQIWWRANPESNSIGNLVLHLCGNARQWIVSGVGGKQDNRNRDTEFAHTGVIERARLLSTLRSTISEVEAVLNNLDPSTLLESRWIQGCDVDVLEAIFHVTEHFSMHTGQIILLTKQLTAKSLNFYDFGSGTPEPRW